MILALKTFNRPEYLKRSLESLKRSSLPAGTFIVIRDDASGNKKTHDLINNIDFGKGVQKTVIISPINEGVDQNCVRIAKHCFEKTKEDYIIILDDDAIYNINWYHKLLEAKESIKENKIGIVSCFNTKVHSFISKYNELVGIKEVVGGICSMIHKDIALSEAYPSAYPERYVGNVGWLCKSKGYKVFCTYKSYVEHIGLEGLNKRLISHPFGVIDKAENFIGEK